MPRSKWISLAAVIGLAAAWAYESACRSASYSDRGGKIAPRTASVPGVAEDSSGSAQPVAAGKKCVVLLHGKSAGGRPDSASGDVTYLQPGGNAEGWGGRQWLYFPDDRYQEVRATVARVIADAGCGRVVVQGFSNGAAAAARMYCRGERFGGRVTGYIVDDPVPDRGVEGCRPPADVRLRLYWTGALSIAGDGWSCMTEDWTCEGGQTIGIDKYAAALGTEPRPSIHTTHREYSSPPEQTEWLTESR